MYVSHLFISPGVFASKSCRSSKVRSLSARLFHSLKTLVVYYFRQGPSINEIKVVEMVEVMQIHVLGTIIQLSPLDRSSVDAWMTR